MGTVNRARGEERFRRRSGSGRRMAPVGRRHGKAELGPAERRRLVQLTVCLALFLVVFVGKGIFPDRMSTLREDLLSALRQDTDFQAVFSALGQSVAKGEPVMEALGILWGDLPEARTEAAAAFGKAQAELLCGVRQAPEAPEGMWTFQLGLLTPLPQPETEGQTQSEPEAEPVVEHVEYDGPALPEGATMDKYRLEALGVGETVTPALGWVSSPFGWREHPVDGGEKFHNGVDLAVNNGTEVLAFADGTVDYIGDSPVYGLYLQLSHAGGLKTFYAHCSQLCVQQGQTVTAGEVVALSGDTGNATGPHLHFEMKVDGVRIDPLYYIQTS